MYSRIVIVVIRVRSLRYATRVHARTGASLPQLMVPLSKE
jgi:hypothetical protein